MTRPVEAFAAGYLRLRQLLEDVGDAQWRAGRTPVPREDTTERSRGLVSDPTPAVVFDARRLAVRAAVIEAEQALEGAARVMQVAERRLREAHERWEG